MAVPRLSPPAHPPGAPRPLAALPLSAPRRRPPLARLSPPPFLLAAAPAVRLTGSGLGCTDWPTCEEGRLTPVDATDFHAMVEFVNRTITGLVSVAVILAVLGSLARVPRRRDLTAWSLGLVAGVLGQI